MADGTLLADKEIDPTRSRQADQKVAPEPIAGGEIRSRPNLSLVRYFRYMALMWAALLALIPMGLGAPGPLIAAGGVASIAFLFLAQTHQREIYANRRQVAAEIRERYRRLNASPLRARIVEAIRDPLLLIGPDRRILIANASARQLFGETLAGETMTFHIRHPSVIEAVEAAIEDGEASDFDITLRLPAERSYMATVTRIESEVKEANLDRRFEDTDDIPDFYVLIALHDTTNIHKAERMRADFVANASHELRTPLSSLIGFIETLKGPARGDVEAADRFLGIMLSESTRMVRLIDDLLSLSRIELDKHVPPVGLINVTEVVRSVCDSLEHMAARRKMYFKVRMPPDLPPVLGDRDQVVQVLQNLINNSIKYGYEGTVIEVVCDHADRVRDSGRPGVRIAVGDKGEGIDSDHLPRLTERFYRVDAGRSRKLGGTGLGLAIVKHIMSRHRGDLEIRSEKGVGTTVKISLPAADADQPITPQADLLAIGDIDD